MVMKSTRKRQGNATALKLAGLGFAAPQVIAHRLTRMALAGPTMSARDRKEFTGMVVEKHVCGEEQGAVSSQRLTATLGRARPIQI